MQKVSVVIVGFGNIGRAVKRVVEASTDMVLAGVVRRPITMNIKDPELSNTHVVCDIRQLNAKVDAVLLCVPTREVEEQSKFYRELGYNTVDSYDEHPNILAYRKQADIQAKATKTVSIIASGWDPGTDSALRMLMQVVAVSGRTTTTFGGKQGGRSMGHTALVRGLEGVKDAVALTLANGRGKHKRLVYISLEEGADYKAIENTILTDPYFENDPTEIKVVDDITPFNTLHHEADIERTGTEGTNQRYLLSGINPEMTAHIMTSCARAALKAAQQGAYGAYTFVERPLIDYAPGETLEEKLTSY